MKHSLYEQYKEDLILGYITEPELVQGTFIEFLESLQTRVAHDQMSWPDFLRQVMNTSRENLLAVEEASRRRMTNIQH